MRREEVDICNLKSGSSLQSWDDVLRVLRKCWRINEIIKFYVV